MCLPEQGAGFPIPLVAPQSGHHSMAEATSSKKTNHGETTLSCENQRVKTAISDTQEALGTVNKSFLHLWKRKIQE